MHVAICHSYSYIRLALLRFISCSGFYNASDDNIVSDAAVDGSYFMDVCARVILFYYSPLYL